MDAVSNVICAYCMTNVSTSAGWEKLFKDAGVKNLKTYSHSMDFNGIRGMIRNEGFANSMRVMFRYATKRDVRKRMDTMNRFFSANPEYFGYGIYVGNKSL